MQRRPMSEGDIESSLREIRSLRRQGLITAKEAYERHLTLLSGAPEAPPAADAPRAAGDSLAALDLLAVAVALFGGALGIVGAFFQELQSGGFGILLAFAGAPIIEEALKPGGVYFLLARWPSFLEERGRVYTAGLAATAGLTFGLIESLVYVTLYFPEGGAGFVLFRFTVPVLMHGVASFLVGLGLSRQVIDWAAGRSPLPKATRNFYIAGVLLHAAYNVTVVVLSVAGLVDLD